jgi:hypothetical protein
LPIVINEVEISPIACKFSHGFYTIFSGCIEDGSLSVSVDVVCFATILDKEVYKIVLPLSRSIEHWSLRQRVCLSWVHSYVS